MAENFMKKTLDFGLGLALYSKEKIETMVEEMVNRGDVARKDARKLAEELVEKGVEGREEIRKMISDEVHKTVSKLGLADETIRRDELAHIVREQVEAALAAHQANPVNQTDQTGQKPED